MLNFIHLTDVHIGEDFKDLSGASHSSLRTLNSVKKMIAGIKPAPAFTIVSGDLVDTGGIPFYRALREAMSDLGMPVFYALGNHDSRAAFYDGMLDRRHDPAAPHDYDVEIAGVHLIVLDSSIPGRIGGGLDPEQFTFLSSALARNPDAPKILMLHHAPALTDDPNWEWECLGFADTARLAEMLRGRNVAGIFSGHIHQDRVTNWHGIPLVVGKGLQRALDPLFAGDGIRVTTGGSFTLCTLRPSGLTVNFVSLPATGEEVKRVALSHLVEKDRAGK